jgi:hypothetical protein
MRIVGFLGLALVVSACSGAGEWSKPGVSPEKAAQDYSECRHSAQLAHRRDSDIDSDILASRGEDWERFGLLQLKRNEYADSDNARSADFVERCMIGKGYTSG